MFIAMNRFEVVKGKEDAFEAMWKTRDSYLHELKGFIEFHLLKGPEAEDHTLYSSHTVWASKADFEAWTKSETVPPRACVRRQRRQRRAALSRATRSSKALR